NKTASQDNIRVSASKLDKQMNQVGELVIALARLNQLAIKSQDNELISIASDLDQLITEVRDNVLGIRMLPIGSTFSKYRRLVRDLSVDQGKDIELVTHGAETELDKTVIEQLGDPLVHLIRNSLDHGIEAPEVRQANGKNSQGEITLTAKQAQGQVIIEIKDNGKGIDPDVIRHKAIEKGLISTEVQLTEKEILSQIFSAGFSTAEKVTNISGRGVGMDVVKRSIESLRGSIDIDSVFGQGTTITLRLPLTLAIIEGLLLKVGTESIVVPLTMVEECVEAQKTTLKSSKQGFVLRVRESLIPCISLSQWLGNSNELPDLLHVIIVNIDGDKYGLLVDDVIGQQQTVIKSLGSIYQSIKGVSGATILGDGSVAVILDLPQVVQLYDLS
ncbi:MAG: chemotaxis protein CheA, partial [Alteromonadales bacterium]|nr:chemotaxis protein CheA [Alteromonadales bacterium]